MTKSDLVVYVAKKAHLTAKVTGFGTFMVRSRAARKGRNPQTGAPINIPARKTPGFTAGKALKKAIR